MSPTRRNPVARIAARARRSAVAIGADAARAVEDERRGQQDLPSARVPYATELALREVLAESGGLGNLNDVVGYVEFLRSCFEPRGFDVEWLRRPTNPDETELRFEAIVANLATILPPIPVSTAIEIARVADELSGRRDPYREGMWLGDVGGHMRMSSSDGRMGRVLSTAVRFTRPTSCVELGTAYGLSALFLLAELERVSPSGRLTTIEVREPQHGIAKALLEHRHGDAVRCALVGNAQDLPAVLDAARPIDLVFHDAEHSGDAYQRDFELLFPRLAPRAVVIFDNIRWDHKVFSRGPSRTYDGWRAVADDARCLAAVECSGADVGDSWGLVLVRGPAPS